jgi:hypothetical protein
MQSAVTCLSQPRSRSFLILNFAFLIPIAACAQPAAPHIGYVYPAGGRAGVTFQVVIGGQSLDGVTNAFVSGDGVQATVVDFNKPMPPGQFNNLRDKFRELQDRKAAARRSPNSTNVWTVADEKTVAEIREKILKNPPNRQGNPAIAEVATLSVTLTTNAEPGQREIRLGTPTGLSNPLVFCVDHLPELSQPPAKAPNPDVDRFRERFGKPPAPTPATSETRITLPTVVNGQIMPGRVDRFRFAARKGQQLVAAVSARELIPYLSDAVPGWFQATLALYDAKGKELAYDDDFRFHPDPVLHYVIPKDGEYLLEIKDAIYRGREDFVYRISVGELPFLTGIFPLGGKAGESTTVELQGWNLPLTKLTQENRTPGLQFISVTKDEHVSNRMPFAVDDLPEVVEQEPNDDPAHAQRVTLPVIINGRINHPGDADVFRFDGHAGEEIVAEVTARRLDSPLDSVLKVTDAAGKQIAFNDDTEDKASGLHTHHADSYLRVTLPADGACYLHLGDTQRKGGAEYAYRLRLSAPRPDFALRVVPSTVSLRGGASASLTAIALRRDGFTNEIALTLSDAPAGFKLGGARVPAGADQVKFTLTAPQSPLDTPVSLSLEGHAMIQDRSVSHPAVPADDLTQAFAYHHLVSARELKVAVIGRGAARTPVKILSDTPVKIPVGGTARVRFEIPAGRFAENLRLELNDPPPGLSIKNVSITREATELVLQSDAAKSKPGLKGNLVVDIFVARPAEIGKARPLAAQSRNPLGTLPAIPFETVPYE